MDGHLFMCNLNRFNWGKKLHSGLRKIRKYIKIFLVKKKTTEPQRKYLLLTWLAAHAFTLFPAQTLSHSCALCPLLP